MGRDHRASHITTCRRLTASLNATNADGVLISIVDVFSGVWGPCSVLAHAVTDISAAVLLGEVRLLQVNATAVLKDYAAHLGEDGFVDAELGEAAPDTHPDAFVGYLEEQEERSRPQILLYKNGVFKERVLGCETPYIRQTVLGLRKSEEPPSHYLRHNDRFLEQWMRQFGGDTSCSLAEFLQAVNVWCLYSDKGPALTHAEQSAVAAAFALPADRSVVHLSHIAPWLGDRPFERAILELLGDYDERYQVWVAEQAKPAQEKSKKVHPQDKRVTFEVAVVDD
eukprot:TRINITY_DN11043_c0_g1_i1.p1 TRINITY_DN11043_c0_g1~~TRINITY_DN11043_c0_g1_i1.p1  ORF type:complete len:282 (+),score=89.73 TRINITY_DN11043_c0_g1_i1:81-926(+)